MFVGKQASVLAKVVVASATKTKTAENTEWGIDICRCGGMLVSSNCYIKIIIWLS